MSIEELGKEVSEYITGNWKKIFEENKEDLTARFPEYGDAVYGMYMDILLPPIWHVVEKNGFQSAQETREDDFLIGGCLNFRHSVEKAKWGTPDHEIRMFWIVIENKWKKRIGTLLFEFSHSHLQFDIPAAPALTAFTGTEKKGILAKIKQEKENHPNS
jgi:hypothetical protein